MLNPGELVLIPVSFTNLSFQKRCLVIVISSCEYNQSSRDVLVVAVTPNIQPMPYRIPLSSEDMTIGTLNRASLVRADGRLIILAYRSCNKSNRLSDN